MADNTYPWLAAEGGTYSATSSRASLSGTAANFGVYPSRTFAQVAADSDVIFESGSTSSVVIAVDGDNWSLYFGAVWTSGSPNYIDLSSATLSSSEGSVPDGATVTVYAVIPLDAVQAEVVDDLTPQLGGDLDVNGNSIASTANGNIEVVPHGTGAVLVTGLLPLTYVETGSTSTLVSSGVLTLPLDGRVHEFTLSENITSWTVTPPTAPITGSAVVILEQDATAYTVAYPATWLWLDGAEVDIGTAEGDKLELVIRSTPGGDIHVSAAAYSVA